MFNFILLRIARDTKHIKLRFVRQIMTPHIHISRCSHVRYLLAVNCIHWITIIIRPSLNFGKHNPIILHSDDVHLIMAHAPIALHYRVALPHQLLAGEILAPLSKLIMLCHIQKLKTLQIYTKIPKFPNKSTKYHPLSPHLRATYAHQ